MIRVATITSTIVSGTLLVALAGCEFGPKKIEQTGYRGTGGAQVTAQTRLVAQPIPAPPYALPADGGPTAAETYQNVKVVGAMSAERFNHLMASMNEWVAPKTGDAAKIGCNYCHNPENMASDEKYTKVVARRMLQMTLDINSTWSSHVRGTGVTCYTCHRGNAIPANVWARADPPESSMRTMGNKHGQNTPTASVAYSSLPYDSFTSYLGGKGNIRVAGKTPLRTTPAGASIARTEKTYGLMMHMSSALNVNCTYCHNTDSFGSWSNSRPQRAYAWYAIRMIRDVNENYITSLTSVFPANRKGPHGDVYKVNCITCHQGLPKPLGGVSMLPDYPYLANPDLVPAIAPATPAAPAAATATTAALAPVAAVGVAMVGAAGGN